jgi:methylglyoxal synthase
MVVEGQVKAVFFFVDPLGKHPHDPDIQMLLRICNVHNVPLATNPATALCIIAAMEVANAPESAYPELEHLKEHLQSEMTLKSE